MIERGRINPTAAEGDAILRVLDAESRARLAGEPSPPEAES
jgi:hypothetical protein